MASIITSQISTPTISACVGTTSDVEFNNKIGSNLNGVEGKEKKQKELTQLAKKYNLTYEQLVKFLSNATGIDEDTLLGNDLQSQFVINKTLPQLLILTKKQKGATSQEQKLEKIAKNFKASIDNGNSIEEATNFVENFGQHSVLDILKNKYPKQLKNCTSLNDIPRNILKEYVQEMINESEELRRAGKISLGKSITIFQNLLDRTSDADKEILFDVYKEIAGSDEKVQALAAMINKTENKENLQNFLKKFTPETIQALNLDSQDIARANHLLAGNLDVDGVRELQNLQFEFAEKLNAKVQELKNKNPEEYTEEDKKALEALEYVKQSFAGMATGYQANKNLSVDAKAEYTNNILNESKEINIYDDVLKNISVLMNDQSGIVNFTDQEKEQFSSFLNEATNGDFQKAVELKNQETKEETSEATNEKGLFKTPTRAEVVSCQNIINEHMKAISAKSDDTNTTMFKVEPSEKSEVTTVAEAKEFAGSFTNFVKEISDYCDSVIVEAAKTVARFGDAAQVYFANLGGWEFTTEIAKNNAGWSLEQIKNLNLSFAQHKELTKEAEEREEKLELG